MASSTYCLLNNLPSPPSNSVSSTKSRTAQASISPHKERSWKNQCLLGLTCAMIGFESGSLLLGGDQEGVLAMEDMELGTRTTIIVRPQTWSEKRSCKPWRHNSLETIVPENLPRPSARRRWGAVGSFEAAPPVKVLLKSDAKSCFYM